MAQVKPIPEGFHTVTPHLTIRGAAQAMDFFKKAFGAQETMRMDGPDGRLMHGEMRIGDSVIMLADEFPEQGSKATNSSLMIYCDNADAMVKRAAEAGATVKMPPTDMFWGDRYAKLSDPFGNEWSVATHIKDISPAEMKKAMENMAQQKQ
jgi:uncharacterized glyoxalase superfamily protein PhnB